jgi:hypothetical protein
MKNTVVIALFALGSCQSAEHINKFSTSSLAGLKGMDLQSVGFDYYCGHFSEAALQMYTDTSLYGEGKSAPADCSGYKQADSILKLVGAAIQNYLSALQAVSDPGLIALKSKTLTDALAGMSPAVFPALSFTDDKKAAVRDLLDLVLNEPLKAYRLNRLLKVIRRSDSSFSRVVVAYEFMLSPALSDENLQSQENYKSYVYGRMYRWARTPDEKIQANAQYRQFMAERASELAAIKKDIRVLETIRQGHHVLATQKPSAGFREVEDEISKDVLLINDLTQDIIQLRN